MRDNLEEEKKRILKKDNKRKKAKRDNLKACVRYFLKIHYTSDLIT